MSSESKFVIAALSLFAGLFLCAACSPNAVSNESIQIASSAMKKDDQGLKFIEVTVVFRKRVTGRTEPDKGVNIFSQLRRYGEMPDKTKLFYFDSDPRAKVFVDLYDLHGKLIRTDASYYDEYIPSLANGKVAEILPGEKKTFMFNIPEDVESYRVWLINSSKVGGP